MGPDAIEAADDMFRSPRQIRLESAKLTFAKGYKPLNQNFIVLIIVQTIRLLIYCIQRFQSWEGLLKWEEIPPFFFYSIFVTDCVITLQVLLLVWQCPPKVKQATSASGINESMPNQC